jgi:hypothetical protein
MQLAVQILLGHGTLSLQYQKVESSTRKAGRSLAAIRWNLSRQELNALTSHSVDDAVTLPNISPKTLHHAGRACLCDLT